MGTSQKEINRALSSFLNRIGPGQYDPPSYIGKQPIEGNKKSPPEYSFKQKTKLAAFREYAVVFYIFYNLILGFFVKGNSRL